MREAALRHGVSLDGQRATKFDPCDLKRYDFILAMDKENLGDILSLGSGKYADKVKLFREFDPEPGNYEVPDPYYGGEQGFETVYQIIERTANQLLDNLLSAYDMDGA